jgi:hypothetical protein
VREDPRPDWSRDDPELEGWLLEEDFGLAGTAPGCEPVADLQNSIDGERVDGLIGLEIGLSETDEQR